MPSCLEKVPTGSITNSNHFYDKINYTCEGERRKAVAGIMSLWTAGIESQKIKERDSISRVAPSRMTRAVPTAPF